jgi:hypothetical protein
MIIEGIDHRPTLAVLSRVCSQFRNFCTPRLWKHLDIHGAGELAIIILSLRSNPRLAIYVHTVAFLPAVQRTDRSWHQHGYLNCSAEGTRDWQEYCKTKILDACEGREDTNTATADLSRELPQKLFRELDAHGVPPEQRSYALSRRMYGTWSHSFETGLLASPTRTLGCLCFEGFHHYTLELDIVKPYALHLYGEPDDWLLDEGSHTEPTFARFHGIKQICFSIHLWRAEHDDDDMDSIFDRCREYEDWEIHQLNGGPLEKVVIRMTREAIERVCSAYHESNWLAKHVVEFRLWDFTEVTHEYATEREFADGTWCDWVDQPDILGRQLSLADLRDMAKGISTSDDD